ncbi:MAG: hypothetical protein HY329_22325, partial [Chloroflexi bacterium]|nr:hypothetical protein [Chloroflexota bacterium]
MSKRTPGPRRPVTGAVAAPPAAREPRRPQPTRSGPTGAPGLFERTPVLLGALLAVALLARLAYQAQVHSVGLFGLNTVNGSDMLGFVTWAQEILSGDLIGGSRGAFYQGPLYPYFLAFWLFLFRGSTMAAAVAQATLGAA